MQIRKCMRMKRTCWMDPCVAGVVEDKLFIVLTPPTVKQATCRRNGSLREMDSAFFFVFDFSNPQTLRRVSVTNYVTVVFEAGSAVHSLQKNGGKGERIRSEISCAAWTSERYDA